MLNRHDDGGFKTHSYQDAAPQEILSSLVMREFRHRMANTLTVLHSSLRQQLLGRNVLDNNAGGGDLCFDRCQGTLRHA